MSEIEYLRLSRRDIVNARAEPYMERWIARTRGGDYRLHHILCSDDDRALHDHPFNFTSVILFGAYVEHVPRDRWDPAGPTTTKLYGPGDVLRRRAEDPHRLELPFGPVWTAVRTGPRRRDWGFYIPGRWMHWKEYEKLRNVDFSHGKT